MSYHFIFHLEDNTSHFFQFLRIFTVNNYMFVQETENFCKQVLNYSVPGYVHTLIFKYTCTSCFPIRYKIVSYSMYVHDIKYYTYSMYSTTRFRIMSQSPVGIFHYYVGGVLHFVYNRKPDVVFTFSTYFENDTSHP